ncbi:unnamed protein product [Cylindrotheca closterium]|uniref:Uncharacterized protein n=1 Tax=Cylindrotheca closterium TaxID=2856 RepID=A0AAD2G610_9STRA|nr:unnamed protein product [Cylindrotheca closterium]
MYAAKRIICLQNARQTATRESTETSETLYRLLPKIQWKNPDQFVDYGKKLNLNQIGATVPATVTATVPGASPSTSGASSVAGSVNTPLQLAGTTGNQMMQVPSRMQLMQIPTLGGGTVTVPNSMNANGKIAFSGMQLGHQGSSAAQVRQGLDATQAQTPQVVKTGYLVLPNVFYNAIKGKDENGNDFYLIPCPAGTSNFKLQPNRRSFYGPNTLGQFYERNEFPITLHRLDLKACLVVAAEYCIQCFKYSRVSLQVLHGNT